MKSIATHAPWLSTLYLFSGKLRPTGIGPAQTLWEPRKKLRWKAQDIRNRSGSVHLSNTPCSHHWEVTGVPSPLCSTTSAWSMRIVRVFFSYFFIYKGACCDYWSDFRTSKSSCQSAHDTSPDPCLPLIIFDICSNHCTMPEDDCKQPRPLPDSLFSNRMEWPTAAAFAPGLPDLFPTNCSSAKQGQLHVS